MSKTESALPQTDRIIQIADSSYVSPFTGDKYIQDPYEARCSEQLINKGKNYRASLCFVPNGYRMSNLDEIAYLIQREAKLKKHSKNPREVLQDSLFERHIKSDPYLWMHSNVALRAQKGAKNLGAYKESDGQGREFARVDYLIGEKVIAEGVRVPISTDGKVVEWIIPLRIPAIISYGDEPQHTIHWYLDTDEKEVAVRLDGYWFGGGLGGCLLLDAAFRRSFSNPRASFRLFQGSLDDVPIPHVEYHKK